MRTRLAAASVVVLGLGLVLSACATAAPSPGSSPGASAPGASSPSASSRPPFQTTTPGAVGPTGTPADVPAAQWTAIQDDLSARGVSGTPGIVSAEQVTFSDGSLGCAEPGQSYTQALIDGMRVVVDVGGTTYDYRFGEGAGLKLCTR